MQPSENVVERIGVISDGVIKSFENATSLFEEAVLLREHRRVCRALFLHQISLEECGKCEILGWAVTAILAGQTVEMASLSKRIRDHREKNFANAYMLPVGADEAKARTDGNWLEAKKVFSQLQAKFHGDSNAAKNAALYVNCDAVGTSSPSDTITESMVEAVAFLNNEFISMTRSKVDMLRAWLVDPKASGEQIRRFISRLEEVRDQGAKAPDEIISMVMNEWRGRNTR